MRRPIENAAHPYSIVGVLHTTPRASLGHADLSNEKRRYAQAANFAVDCEKKVLATGCEKSESLPVASIKKLMCH